MKCCQARARELQQRHGVDDEAAGIDQPRDPLADGLVFPVIVKAAAGGGGIGMRRADDPAALVAAVTGGRCAR